jgi:hypothetical protein
MSNSVNQILQAKNSSLKETTQHRLLHDLLTLYSFSEELVFTVGYIKKRKYSVKIKNEKYKKAFADFYNRLPTLEIFTADTDSALIKELLQQINIHLLKSNVKMLGYDFTKAINVD